jgi:hypothetical protein
LKAGAAGREVEIAGDQVRASAAKLNASDDLANRHLGRRQAERLSYEFACGVPQGEVGVAAIRV